jgi:hypothetical protein
MMSAKRPASSRPRSSTSMSSAATVVAARMAPSGRHAPIDQGDQLLGVAPVGYGRGVGAAGDAGAPTMALLMVSLARGKTSAALAWSSGAACDTSMPSARYVVGTRNRAALDEQVEGFVGHQRPVLDAVDAGLDGGADPLVAVGVGGHLEPGPVRFVDDGPQLLVGVLLGARRAGVGHHPHRRRRP